jgi:hypothetical protein
MVLGITVDENLKWTEHIDIISKKISKVLGIMTRIKNALPSNILLSLYNTLILPHLNYGLMLWGWKADRLEILQKRAVRTISKSHYRAHTINLFKELKILKIADLCALQDYKFCYKLSHNQLPYYFQTINDMSNNSKLSVHQYQTRNKNNERLPFVKHEFAKQCISYRYPLILNNIPKNIKDKIETHNFFGYRLYIKKIILGNYNGECSIPNCFSCAFN